MSIHQKVKERLKTLPFIADHIQDRFFISRYDKKRIQDRYPFIVYNDNGWVNDNGKYRDWSPIKAEFDLELYVPDTPEREMIGEWMVLRDKIIEHLHWFDGITFERYEGTIPLWDIDYVMMWIQFSTQKVDCQECC